MSAPSVARPARGPGLLVPALASAAVVVAAAAGLRFSREDAGGATCAGPPTAEEIAAAEAESTLDLPLAAVSPTDTVAAAAAFDPSATGAGPPPAETGAALAAAQAPSPEKPATASPAAPGRLVVLSVPGLSTCGRCLAETRRILAVGRGGLLGRRIDVDAKRVVLRVDETFDEAAVVAAFREAGYVVRFVPE